MINQLTVLTTNIAEGTEWSFTRQYKIGRANNRRFHIHYEQFI